MKYVIWGVGIRGKRIASKLPNDDIIAFIDSYKAGSYYQEKPVIDFQEYQEKFSEYFILVTPHQNEEIKRELMEAGICWFWDFADCPSELQHTVIYKEFWECLKSYCNRNRCGVYGTSFYSIFFYEMLYKNGCKEIRLIPEKDASQEKVQRIVRTFDFVKLMPNGKWEQYVDGIYATVDIREKALQMQKESGLKVTDVFDLSCVIPQYRNEGLKKFKNRHNGERCFIVATGPSLKMGDLEKLRRHGEWTVSVNRIYLAFGQTDWRPDYYIVSDHFCISESEKEIKKLSARDKFVSDMYPEFWDKDVPDNVYQYHCHYSYAKNYLPAYSEDIEYRIYGCATVTYEAIQLATYMGFKEIYLLGVDFDFKENYKDESNHFVKNYYNEESKTGVFAKEQQLRAYRSAKQYAQNHGIRIYNATRGGKLEVFERVDFDRLFDREQERESVE